MKEPPGAALGRAVEAAQSVDTAVIATMRDATKTLPADGLFNFGILGGLPAGNGLTDDRMAPVKERIKGSGAFPEQRAPLQVEVGRAEAQSIETFLAALREDHGGVEGSAATFGLSVHVVASLRATPLTSAR